jgi:hypothetical protein
MLKLRAAMVPAVRVKGIAWLRPAMIDPLRN